MMTFIILGILAGLALTDRLYLRWERHHVPAFKHMDGYDEELYQCVRSVAETKKVDQALDHMIAEHKDDDVIIRLSVLTFKFIKFEWPIYYTVDCGVYKEREK